MTKPTKKQEEPKPTFDTEDFQKLENITTIAIRGAANEHQIVASILNFKLELVAKMTKANGG